VHHLVTIVRPDDDSITELLVDELWRAGAVGVEEIDRSIRAAFTDTATATSVALRHGGRAEDVADTTGLDSWRDHAADYRAGRFHVRPPWIDPDSTGRFVDLVIDPGHAFGSGSHPTTRLMLTAFAEHIGPGDRVVDLGTGSGILAIAAARLGADVIGIDLDPAAAPAAQANAMANGVRERVDVRIGDISDISDIGNDEPFDVALLNVTIDIHESVAPAVERLDVPVLIVAGILDGEQAERAARLHGRNSTERLSEDGWVALVFDRGRDSAAT
jgi:ribosomal protein L11 methyltransferase